MKRSKYIQETGWFKAGRDRAVKALDKEYHENTDNAILEALGAVSNPKTTVLANIMLEAQRQEKRIVKSEGVGVGEAGAADG